ncbi:MAG: purine nucleoside phosphorylase [Candidatus Sericytochromatia bacterium]|nr:MAG: purine nucleoside phosphorylase [Candidatus Sericytochromatia bacterium]
MEILNKETINFVKKHFNNQIPDIGIVLGSGLKIFENLENQKDLKYSDIPNFPKSTVEGHDGLISIGNYENKNILILRGRFHKYEGYSWNKVVSPIYLLKELGTKILVLTNAAGGINRNYEPGDLMLIEDHINFHLIDSNERKELYKFLKGRRFIEYYNKELNKLILNSAIEAKVKIHQGIYLSLPGPNYETRAEVLMFRKLNIDAVGMSTVPEAIWANAWNMKVIGISCITNSTYYEKTMSETSHDEVINVAKTASSKLDLLLKEFIKNL